MIVPVYRRNSVGGKRKDHLPYTFEYRYAMCKLDAIEIRKRLIGKAGKVVVNRIEEKLAKSREMPNYTAETLEILREVIDPEVGLTLIMGDDLVSGEKPALGEWHDLQKIIQLASLAICPRPGYTRNETFQKELQSQDAHLFLLDDVITKNIASSQIKSRLLAGEDPLMLSEEGLITKAIALYVKENDLIDIWRRLEDEK